MTNAEATPKQAGDKPANLDKQMPPGVASQLAQKLVATPPAGSGSAEGKVETPEELEVMWGNTPRKVKVADLVAAAQKADDVRQAEAVVEKRLKLIANAEKFTALQETIDGLTPVQQQRLMQVLQNPKILDEAEDDEPDDEDSPLMRAARSKGTKDSDQDAAPRDPRIDELMAQVRQLTEFAQRSVQKEQQQTLQQKLDSVWNQYPTLTSLGDGSDVIRRSILAQFAVDPQKGLDKIVAETAQAMQRFSDRKASDVLTDITGSPTPQLPAKEFKADDLNGRKIANHIQALLSRR